MLLNAGLKGIEEEYPLPEESEQEAWRLSDRERKALGVRELPHNLDEAIHLMEESELVADTLGERLRGISCGTSSRSSPPTGARSRRGS